MLAGMHIAERDPMHDDRGSTRSLHACAHFIEHIRKINDLRFARGVIDNGRAFSSDRSHKHVFRSTHAGKIEEHLRCMKPIRARGIKVTMIVHEIHTQCFEHGKMHVDLARTDLAAAGHCDARLAKTPNERT